MSTQRVDELGAIDRVPARHDAGEHTDLVALEPADEVPARRHRLPQLRGLGDELLRAVLAEIGRARVERGAHARGVDRLRDRDERDVVARAS
jgi:hypothetical protein